MINKKYNKAFPVDNLSEIQQKLFGFDEFDHGKVKKVKSKNRCKSNYIQSQFDVRDYKDPEIIVSEEYQNKYYFDEDGVLSTLNPLCPHCHSRKVTQ